MDRLSVASKFEKAPESKGLERQGSGNPWGMTTMDSPLPAPAAEAIEYQPATGGPLGLAAVPCSALSVPREEYEALLKDKARLDYLEQAHVALNARYETEYGWKLIINHNVVRFMAGNCYPRDDGYPGIDLHDSEGGNAKLQTCREAIDACMPNDQALPEGGANQ